MNFSDGKAIRNLSVFLGAFVLVAYFSILAIWKHDGYEMKRYRGVLRNPSDWPEPIQDLAAGLNLLSKTSPEKSTATIESELALQKSGAFEVLQLSGKSEVDWFGSYLCRMKYSEVDFEHLKSMLDLHLVDYTKAWSARQIDDSQDTGIFWPELKEPISFYYSQTRMDGQEGPQFEVAVDQVSAKIYIHYWFNF